MRYTVGVNKAGTFWYKEGTKKLHREDGPAVEYSSGHKEWWLNGKLHREDGPAVEYSSGHKYWYKNDKRHREDGPAVEWSDGNKSWFLDGKEYTKEEFNEELNRRNSLCSGKIVEIDGKKYKLTEV